MDDSLEEEWVDQGDEQDMSIAHDIDIHAHDEDGSSASHDSPEALNDNDEQHYGSGSSATAISPNQGGTFLIRADVQHEPVTPAKRAPGAKGKLNPFTKSIFSPLALEKMFEPPSPPAEKIKPVRGPSALSQSHLPPEISFHPDFQHEASAVDDDDGRPDEIVASDIPNLVTFDGRKPSSGYNFTFHVPHDPSPSPPRSPPIDPRLRLFQTYDTYTKDQLSALVDTIAVKSNAGSPSEDNYSRSSKRIKLSAPESVNASPERKTANASLSTMSPVLSRPNSRRDYLGESKSLMEQIKNNRSFSIATTTSEPRPLSLVEEESETSQEQG